MSHQDPTAEAGVLATLKRLLRFIIPGKSAGALAPSTAEQPTSSSSPSVISPLDHESSIIIVGGGGTMGSSTALHLARRGYKNIRILDTYEIPSSDSAGNDINKICANTSSSGLSAKLGEETVKAWQTDGIFKPYFHRTGELNGEFSLHGIADIRARYDGLVASGMDEYVEWLETEDDIVRKAPHLKNSDIKGWKGLFNSNAGWVAARDALDSVGRELMKLGVKSTFGPAGTFKEPILSEDGQTCIGVLAVDGSKWLADRVVLATGAWSPTLIDLKGQCESKCWVYAHLQLTPEESASLKGIPVLYNGDLGFFFEPRETGLLKLCNEFPGFTHLVEHTPFGAEKPTTISVPRSHASHPTDTMPTESLEEIKRLIKVLLPQFEGRELINQAVCWCTDTHDAQWLLCEDPRWKGLYLATGDSGHTFKYLPIVGSYIADMLEGKFSEEENKVWGWRPGRGDPDHTGRGGPPPKDLAEMPGWRHDEGSDI